MEKSMLNEEILKNANLVLLSETETTEIEGGGWLTTLIGAAFTLLGNWVVSLFNEGLDITYS